MSAFNLLNAVTICPKCDRPLTFEIQFKFGDVWQHEYKVGDRLKWGGNAVGNPSPSEVHVQGLGGPCPSCGVNFQLFSIIVKNGQIVDVRPTSEDEYMSMEPLGFRDVSSETREQGF
jgi:hypothetical protein